MGADVLGVQLVANVAVTVDVGVGRTKNADIGIDIYLSPQVDIRADAMHLPLRSEVVDRLVASHVIEHVPNPGLLLREISRVIKPNGTAEIRYPTRRFIHSAKFVLVYLFFQFPFWTPSVLAYVRDILTLWAKRDPRRYHRYWIPPQLISQIMSVISVKAGQNFPVWSFLLSGRKRVLFGFLERVSTTPQEIVVLASRRQNAEIR